MENHSDISKNFIPYYLALELKELGFDEPCFAIYGKSEGYLFKIHTDKFDTVDELHFIKAPTYSQAFRWFRQEHGLYSHVRESYAFDNTLEFVTQINGSYVNHGIEDKPINRFETYEEAELECLKKLIEIVKEQNVK